MAPGEFLPGIGVCGMVILARLKSDGVYLQVPAAKASYFALQYAAELGRGPDLKALSKPLPPLIPPISPQLSFPGFPLQALKVHLFYI